MQAELVKRKLEWALEPAEPVSLKHNGCWWLWSQQNRSAWSIMGAGELRGQQNWSAWSIMGAGELWSQQNRSAWSIMGAHMSITGSRHITGFRTTISKVIPSRRNTASQTEQEVLGCAASQGKKKMFSRIIYFQSSDRDFHNYSPLGIHRISFMGVERMATIFK